MSGDQPSKKGWYNASFVSAALALAAYQITIWNPISHIRSIKRNCRTISKRSHPKVYPNEIIAIWVCNTLLLLFHYRIWTEVRLLRVVFIYIHVCVYVPILNNWALVSTWTCHSFFICFFYPSSRCHVLTLLLY